jgi:Zn-dependent peptidase ImmA (M78 family)
MRRGFKAEAERVSEAIRKEIGVRRWDPLDAVELAKHVGAEVKSAEELTSLAKLQTLEELQPGAFSACTFTIGKRHVIVYNPLASDGRTQSDLAHEVAHIVLKHNMNSVQTIAGISFFTCDADEEQEANWLAGCLLLPRQLLYRAVKGGLDSSSIAATFKVSESMAAFRVRTTGVAKQLEATKRRARSAARGNVKKPEGRG